VANEAAAGVSAPLPLAAARKRLDTANRAARKDAKAAEQATAEAARQAEWQRTWPEVFLAELAIDGDLSRAIRAAGLPWNGEYWPDLRHRIDTDEAFCERWDEIDARFDEATRLAREAEAAEARA
jgi:hypothetical protein